LLLLLPAILGGLWKARRFFTPAAGWFLAVLVAVPALACLYWSGSKGGWLLMLGLAAITFLRMPFNRRYKLILVGALLLLGGIGFAAKYAGFFQKGATSVVARFDYWRAALQVATTRPLFGSGPGTFAIEYQQLKRPEAEMSRLVHNDYLEQASESGWPGFLLYAAFVAGALAWTAPRRLLSLSSESSPVSAPAIPVPPSDTQPEADWPVFSVWLGVLAWAVQSLFEFDLYLPALAWPAFTLLGWLVGRNKGCSLPAEARPGSKPKSATHQR
jgi:O-antigen ligase